MSDAAARAKRSLVGRVVLGRYRVLRHIADGGMGAIYLARSEGAGGFVRPVVVKFLLPTLMTDENMVHMFMREARIMSNLRHPGIVSVIDFAQEDDMHVMVLDYVHGFHLGRWQKFIKTARGPFPAEVAVHVVLQTMRALHYAHTLRGADGSPLNIVHRDVTPSNILLDVEGHVRLADFGIARANTERTEAGQRSIKGKFPYLAPELLEGVEPTPGTDVYAAGVTLHELLVGRNPFKAPSVPAIVSRVLNHVPPRVDAQRNDISPELTEVVARALAKKPDARYRSAGEFADALAAARKLSDDAAASLAAQMAADDFRNPEMAAQLGVPQLNDLEASWQVPGPSSPVRLTTRSKPDTDEPTLAQSPGAISDAEAHPRSTADPIRKPAQPRRWLYAVAAVAVAVVGAVAAVAITGAPGPAPTEPAYIVVSDRDDAPPAPAAEPPAPTQPTEAPTPTDEATAPEPERRTSPPRARKPVDTATRLTRTFERRKRDVRGCFNAHAIDVSGAPEMSIRFELAANGKVKAAQLLPASIEQTALGECLLRVARNTKFGPVGKPLAFRVPIKARVK